MYLYTMKGDMGTERRQNEAALACAARGGDRGAMRELLLRNWGWLKALVYSAVRDVQDRDDVLQDICVRVIGKIETLREPERFRPWLAVLARRQALRFRRQRSRSLLPLDGEIAEQACDEKAGRFIENIERKELCWRILDAVNALPEKYREVFLMEYCGDLTYAQIAEILDVPITTVQIRLVRARKMIHNRVAGKDRVAEK